MHGGLGNVGMHVWHVHECVMPAGTLRGGGHRVGQLHSRFSREAVIFAISIGIRFRELQ